MYFIYCKFNILKLNFIFSQVNFFTIPWQASVQKGNTIKSSCLGATWLFRFYLNLWCPSGVLVADWCSIHKLSTASGTSLHRVITCHKVHVPQMQCPSFNIYILVQLVLVYKQRAETSNKDTHEPSSLLQYSLRLCSLSSILHAFPMGQK